MNLDIDFNNDDSSAFQRACLDYLRDHSIHELSVAVDVSIPTVERWIMGRNHPHKHAQPGVIELLSKLMKEEKT